MKSYIIPGILFLGTVYFGYLFLVTPPGGHGIGLGEESSEGKVPYNRVENLKQQTLVRMGLRKQQAELRKTEEKMMLNPNAERNSRLHKIDLRDDYGPAARDVDRRNSASAITMDQKMDEFLAQKERAAELNEQQRQMFIKRFMEEAYKSGYEIKINDDMEIVSFRELDKPN